jgi:hypothetical protein
LIDPSLFTHSAKYLAPNGIFISTGPLPKNFSPSEIWKVLRTVGAIVIPSWLGNVNRRYRCSVLYCWALAVSDDIDSIVSTKNDEEDLKEIRKLLADGVVLKKPSESQIDSVFRFLETECRFSFRF